MVIIALKTKQHKQISKKSLYCIIYKLLTT